MVDDALKEVAKAMESDLVFNFGQLHRVVVVSNSGLTTFLWRLLTPLSIIGLAANILLSSRVLGLSLQTIRLRVCSEEPNQTEGTICSVKSTTNMY